MKIKQTILFLNKNVATFGEDGEQINELQGVYSIELHRKIILFSDNKTEWVGSWPGIMEAAQIKIEYPGRQADAALLAIEEMNKENRFHFDYIIDRVSKVVIIWTNDVDDIFRLGMRASKILSQ